MDFIVYDLAFLIIGGLLGLLFLYKRRKNLNREMGIFLLYRTKVGIKFIENASKKYKRLLGALKYVIIVVGYCLMISFVYFFGRSAYEYIAHPQISRAIDSPPIALVLPYFPRLFGMQSFFPEFYATYFLVAFIIVATVHEFSHGIYARLYKVRIKSTGVAFLGPLLAGAFVEQDDKQMEKVKKTDQMAILGAGVFANLLVAIVSFLIWWLLFSVNFVPNGAMFDYTQSNINVSSIINIGGTNITNPTRDNLITALNEGVTVDLIIESEGEKANLTKLYTREGSYYFNAEPLKQALEETEEEPKQLRVYSDFPAINSGLKGSIIEIEGKKVDTYNDLNEILPDYNPGDKINIKTYHNGEILQYDLELTEDPDEEGRAVMGISSTAKGLLRFDNLFAIPFKESSTDYRSKSDFLGFLYYLVFWVFLINLLVAVFNMLPAAIFDGGRFFYLTVWGITKNEKIARKAFKWSGILLLLLFLGMIIRWLSNILFF